MIGIGNQRVVINLDPIYSLFRIEFKTSAEKIFALIAYLCSIKCVLTISGLFKLSRWATSKYRKSAEKHLKEDYTDRPNISPKVVGQTLHHFRRHRQVAAQFGACYLFSCQLLAETQVHDLADSLMQHHVLCLEIAMHGAHLVQSLEAIEDLLEVINSDWFFQFSFTPQDISQLKPITVLQDYELVVSMLKVVEKADHIVVVALLEDADFCLHELLQLGHLHQLFLRGYFHCCLLEGVNILCQVDVSPVALSNQPHQSQIANSQS